jgi:hypothetical protein
VPKKGRTLLFTNATSLSVFRLLLRCETANTAELLFRCPHIDSYSSSRTLQVAEPEQTHYWTWKTGKIRLSVCQSVRPFAENPQRMRSGDILRSKISINRTIDNCSQPTEERHAVKCLREQKVEIECNADKRKI